MKIEEMENMNLKNKSVEDLEFLYRMVYDKADYEAFQVGIDYNIQDVRLVNNLDKKFNLIMLIVSTAYESHCNYAHVMKQVRSWDCIIYNHLNKQKIAVPLSQHREKEHYEGAYVKEPIPGMYEWVLSDDLTSLYPMIMIMLGISPENLVGLKELMEMGLDEVSTSIIENAMHFDGTIVPSEISVDKALARDIDPELLEALKEGNLTVGLQGSVFKRQLGFLPELLKKFYAERKYYKGLMIDAQKELAVVNAEIKLRGI